MWVRHHTRPSQGALSRSMAAISTPRDEPSAFAATQDQQADFTLDHAGAPLTGKHCSPMHIDKNKILKSAAPLGPTAA